MVEQNNSEAPEQKVEEPILPAKIHAGMASDRYTKTMRELFKKADADND